MHAPHDHSGHDHAHDHGHKHKHSHGPGGHHHGPLTFDRAFAIGITLNILFVIVEFGLGFVSQSVALMADAGHNLSDVLGLCVAWAGATLARRGPSKRFTYGLKGSTILAALLNALLLLMAMGAIVFEAVQRIGQPAEVKGMVVVVVAAVGILVNAATAWLFARGQKSDINLRGAYLHMAADATVSAGVMLAGLAIWWTGAAWIDPVTSIVVAALIFWQTWGLLRETVEMSLNAVPRAIDFDQVEAALKALPGVSATHDLHIWPIVDDRDRADRAFGDGGGAGRQLPDRCAGDAPRPFPYRPRHNPDRTRRQLRDRLLERLPYVLALAPAKAGALAIDD